ncbi:hypothetical protein CONPUDRAFT_165974 [Coniophora puteana RWD-64-598 SS2]|uniref:FAD/NAD(P)-binding domain-containing protein n=1 Tax=Coniophora puteana (strain RWD-64-598) TaxID=741705 RepID=A0A5M3MMR2_CONPW|nr:uncharacterized protein CONPUDRAFT_165974 [Coniophora puteana RWD-64-598 SS2]EIW80458.1 hypothetical protein CONPUDRAFT_165974 [Coniophora puteana RWD-64-598 SS2]
MELQDTLSLLSILRLISAPNFPQYIGRTKLADFMESYAIQQELTVWTSSAVSSVPAPVFDEATKRWTVVVNRAGNEVTLNPKHLIIATGIGAPYVPQIPGQWGVVLC